MRAAVAHFAPQGVTTDILHPLVLEVCRMLAKGTRQCTGISAKQARRLAESRALTLRKLGLQAQIHMLYVLGGSNGVNLGMIVTGAMFGYSLEQIRWMISIAGEPVAS